MPYEILKDQSLLIAILDHENCLRSDRDVFAKIIGSTHVQMTALDYIFCFYHRKFQVPADFPPGFYVWQGEIEKFPAHEFGGNPFKGNLRQAILADFHNFGMFVPTI